MLLNLNLTGQEKDKRCSPPVSEAMCKKMLRNQCQPKPGSWDKMQLYSIAKNGENFAGVTPQIFTDYTAEFLLTRGPYFCPFLDLNDHFAKTGLGQT